MFKLFSILLAMNIIASCKSSDDEASTPKEATQESASATESAITNPPASTDPGRPAIDTTSVPQVKLCTMEYNPTRCYYTEYKKEELTENSRIFGWGLNPCSAKVALEDEVKRLSMSPSDFGDATCSPDVSQGACTDIIRECKSDTESPAMVCKISSLSGKNFRDDEVVQSLTSKTCDAKTLAKVELCKRNLYRKDLSFDIQCVQAPDSLVTCGAEKFETCPNTYSPKICEIMMPQDLSTANRQLSFARNECLARKILERRLCFMSSGVDMQQRVVCRSPD